VEPPRRSLIGSDLLLINGQGGMGNFWVFEQGLPLIRGKSQKPNSWFFMVIPIYSWLLVAIHGYKKLSGSCENMEKKNIAISCHCVYLEVFFNFSISIFKF
jgi:hypothetical protein